MNDAVAEKHDFGAEVGRLLDLVVHSLYSEREIFLRELVANAADAMDRRRFESLTDPALALPAEAKVRIVPDKAARTLLIADDGIGMGRQELIDNLGTIARSGTRAFGAALASANPEERPSLIGQFGVGFYSAFMVADRVEVTSRKAASEEAFTWASDGAGQFTIAPAVRDAAGTDIVLHMKSDADEYLDPIRLEAIVRKWADHVTLPITIARDGKDLPANEGTALWRKPRAEVSEQSYNEFYRHLGNIFDTPWATLHWKAEGMLEFFALLFIPGMKPFEPVEGDRDSHVRLHVRRMFITDKAELLPHWLRFVQGVVDTEDLPLNVSREMLQTTPILGRIRKALIGRVLSELKNRAKDTDEYGRFWDNFGPVLKEGAWEDAEHRAEIAPLLRFRSSSQEGWTSLPDYLTRMQAGQDVIYYLAGDNPDALRASPQLEGFRAKGIEVLLLADPIDAFWPDRLDGFEGKQLRSVTQASAELDKGDDQPDISPLLAALKKALGDEVADVRATGRLTDSAVVLAAGDKGPDLQMQRLLRRAGRAMMPAAPVLEVNPRHQLIEALAGKLADETMIAEAAGTLLDLARVQEGDLPRDPAQFARRVTSLLGSSLAG
ncbi:MAG TPA: molecular chaperone HtpG [Acetobacteraceae bacterium]|jgi:molecular chaperone HtpG|nr:molecular chaperone HtpG [Acetobacteraceae bacterium]